MAIVRIFKMNRYHADVLKQEYLRCMFLRHLGWNLAVFIALEMEHIRTTEHLYYFPTAKATLIAEVLLVIPTDFFGDGADNTLVVRRKSKGVSTWCPKGCNNDRIAFGRLELDMHSSAI